MGDERRWWLAFAAVCSPLLVLMAILLIAPLGHVPGSWFSTALHGAAWAGVVGLIALPLPILWRLGAVLIYALCTAGLVFIGDLEIAIVCYGVAL